MQKKVKITKCCNRKSNATYEFTKTFENICLDIKFSNIVN